MYLLFVFVKSMRQATGQEGGIFGGVRDSGRRRDEATIHSSGKQGTWQKEPRLLRVKKCHGFHGFIRLKSGQNQNLGNL